VKEFGSKDPNMGQSMLRQIVWFAPDSQVSDLVKWALSFFIQARWL
jgi:hypothetical protein